MYFPSQVYCNIVNCGYWISTLDWSIVFQHCNKMSQLDTNTIFIPNLSGWSLKLREWWHHCVRPAMSPDTEYNLKHLNETELSCHSERSWTRLFMAPERNSWSLNIMSILTQIQDPHFHKPYCTGRLEPWTTISSNT